MTTTFQRPGGPRRARAQTMVPSDAARAAALRSAQSGLQDDATTSLVERNPYDPETEQPNPPRSAPDTNWMREAEMVEEVEPEIDINAAAVAGATETISAGAFGEEVSITAHRDPVALTGLSPDTDTIQALTDSGVAQAFSGATPWATVSGVTVPRVATGITGTAGWATLDHLAMMIERDRAGLVIGGQTLTWAIEEIERLRKGAVVLDWNLDMTAAPDDGTPVIALGRYQNARAPFPRVAHFIAGAWRDMGGKAGEIGDPLVVWAWMSRDLLPEWPAEPT